MQDDCSCMSAHGRGISTFSKMKDKDDVYEAKGSVCRFQMIYKIAEDNVEKFGFKWNPKCILKEF